MSNLLTEVHSALNPFNDTKNKDVLKAYNLGIVKGTSKDTFSPNALITIEEISVMLNRILELGRPGVDYNYQYKRFEDESEFLLWAIDSIKKLRSMEIIWGDSNNFFNPKYKTTIEQAAIMTYRLLEKKE